MSYGILRHIVGKGSNVTIVEGMVIEQVIVIDPLKHKMQVEETDRKTSRVGLFPLISLIKVNILMKDNIQIVRILAIKNVL